MQLYVFSSLALATCCQSLAALLAWQWVVPLVRTLCQKPVEVSLRRADQIGFSEETFRQRLFALEVSVVVLVIWATVVYAGLILGCTTLVILIHLRTLVLEWIIDSRERLLRQQTLGLTRALDGLVRSGLAMSDAVVSAVRQTPAPLGQLTSRIATDFQRGRPLIEAMNAVRESLRLDAFSLLVTSIICALKQGSSSQSSMNGVQESLEHREQAERQLRAKTSAGRSTVFILACVPPGFALMFGLFWPESMSLIFTTPHGKVALALILGCLYTGIAWARRLLQIR